MSAINFLLASVLLTAATTEAVSQDQPSAPTTAEEQQSGRGEGSAIPEAIGRAPLDSGALESSDHEPEITFAQLVPGVGRGPIYPPGPARRCIDGKVMLRLSIDSEGIVRKIEIDHSSGNRQLDDAAISAAATWRFTPERRNGVPVDSVMLFPISFDPPSWC